MNNERVSKAVDKEREQKGVEDVRVLKEVDKIRELNDDANEVASLLEVF